LRPGLGPQALAPRLSYGYATFSGDDPNTPAYERFDPLFYGNGQNNWSFGSNSSYPFQNANVNFNRITLALTATERDALRLQYIHTRANELQGGIQFGPLARVGVLNNALNVGIIKDPHLADEIYGDWTHTFDSKLSGTLWASIAFPGAGLRSIPFAHTETWVGIGGSLSLSISISGE
jgi:hypothetical protein